MNIINDTELFNIGITGLEGVFTDLSGTVIFSKEGKQWIEDFRNNLNYKNKQFYLTSKDVLTANRRVAIFAERFFRASCWKKSAKITRPPLPSAAPIRPRHLVSTQQGDRNLGSRMT